MTRMYFPAYLYDDSSKNVIMKDQKLILLPFIQIDDCDFKSDSEELLNKVESKLVEDDNEWIRNDNDLSENSNDLVICTYASTL